MIERPSATPDKILASRTLSDAELLTHSAEYQNGVLKVSSEQRESLRRRAGRELGGSAVGSLVLHSTEVSNLEYIGTDEAIKHEAELRSAIEDVTSQYQDILKPYFPDDIKTFRKRAAKSNATTAQVNGREVTYGMTFESRKSKRTDSGVAPDNAYVSIGTYDDYAKGTGILTRDVAKFYYGEDGTIDNIILQTRANSTTDEITGYNYHDKHAFRGVAPELIASVNPDQISADRDRGMVDTFSSVKLELTPGNYRMGIAMRLESKSLERGPQGIYANKLHASRASSYRFDPETNEFIRTDGSDSNAPERFPASVFIALVKRALGNIPTVGDSDMITA